MNVLIAKCNNSTLTSSDEISINQKFFEAMTRGLIFEATKEELVEVYCEELMKFIEEHSEEFEEFTKESTQLTKDVKEDLKVVNKNIQIVINS